MKRKMVYIGISLLSGLLFASFLNDNYDFIAVPFIIISALFLKYPAKFKNIETAVCIISFSCGFFVYRCEEKFVYDKIISYAGQSVVFSGKVVDVSEHADDKSSYTLKGTINNTQNARMIYYGDTNGCEYGDEITLECIPSQFENTYTFNLKDYYKSSDIFIQADEVKSVDVKYNDDFNPVKFLWDYRNKIHRRIMSLMPYDEGNLLSAMLFGSRIADIDDNTRTALYRFGIGHVFAVSGFHLMVIARVLKNILKKFYAGDIITFILVLCSSLIFVICSGFSLSAIRACVMIVVSFSAVIFSRTDDSLNSLCIAITVMTVVNPFVVRNPSFLLSVSGFYGIGVFAPYITKNMPDNTKIKSLIKNFTAMIFMSAVIIPVSALFFNETSAVSAVANIVFMPVLSFVLILGMIVFITGGVSFVAVPVLEIASLLCSFTVSASEYSASLKFVKIPLGFTFIKVIMFILFIFICISFAVFKSRNSVLFSMMLSVVTLSVSIASYQYSSENILTVSVFGNSSSDLIIVECNGSADIIDISGSVKNPDYAFTYAQKYGTDAINNIVVSDKKYRNMAEYNSKFIFYDIKSVFLPYDTYILQDTYICRCTPEYFNRDNISLEYSNYVISADCKNSDVYVKYGNFIIRCYDKVSVYHNDNEIMSADIDEYIMLKTDGISKTEFVR